MVFATAAGVVDLPDGDSPIALRSRYATLSDERWIEDLMPFVQSIHQTFFDDGDQRARIPFSNHVPHDTQEAAYLSEMIRRSLGRSIFYRR